MTALTRTNHQLKFVIFIISPAGYKPLCILKMLSDMSPSPCVIMSPQLNASEAISIGQGRLHMLTHVGEHVLDYFWF